MAFALYEMRIVLRTILAQTRLRLADRGPVRVVRRTITLAPKSGTRVIRTPARPSPAVQAR
jgi:unspecific monooxygenase